MDEQLGNGQVHPRGERAAASRSGCIVRTYVRTFIVYELQFRDGSGLIQFNGAPGELYARRHLVPRSSYEYTETPPRTRVRLVYARAGPLDVYRETRTTRTGGERKEGGTLSSGMLNDNEDNNNLI